MRDNIGDRNGLASGKLRLAIALALVLATSALWAQEGFGTKAPSVTMAPPAAVVVHAGRLGKATLQFRVADGFHINSHQPKSEFLIPTNLKLDAVTNIAVEKTTYPTGQDMSLAFDPGEKLNVYAGDFAVEVMVKPLASVTPGKYTVHGTLRYQACDNAACYPPKNLPVSFEVEVAGGAAKQSPRHSIRNLADPKLK